MTSLRMARRSAERFDALLGDEHSIVDPGSVDSRTAELLELVYAMRSAERVEARPEFVSDLRDRLLLAARDELTAPDPAADLDRRLTVAPRRTPRERRVAIALGGFAIVGATTSMAVAAQSALPGDALYPLKRAIENAETGFRVSDDAKGATILANASGRLDEVDELTRGGSASAEHVEDTLNAFAEQATEASDLLLADYAQTGDEGSINELRDFAATSIAELGALEAMIPPGAEDALLNAADVLYSIDAVAAQVCPTCTGEGITEIPPPLLAAGGQSLDDAQQALGNSATVAAPPLIAPVKEPKQEPTKTEPRPSGTNPPASPAVSVPATPTPSNTADDNPGGGSSPSEDVKAGLGGGAGSGGGGGGGNDDKKKAPTPEEVKTVVDQAVKDVNEVVGGLGDALGGSTLRNFAK